MVTLLKDFASTTPAWSKFPLQQSELTTCKNEVDTPSLLLNINGEDLIKNDKRAMDEKGTLWLWIEHAVDSQNVPIKGWTFIGSEGVKKVSGWEWFSFKQITETSSLKEFYLSAKKATTRNKDNASLENYKPTLKETLTILDKQYIQNSNKYATLTQGCFKGISDKPHLTTSLGRLLVHYQSEWYEELDAEGKRPEWEALNSEMTDDAENYLGYIKDGDEAKRDAYVSKMDASEQESIKQGLEQQRRDYQRFPDGYEDAPDKKLTQEQLNLLGKINELEEKYKLWEKSKEKATKMLWWDDVAKGLAKQKQQTQQSDATTENSKTAAPSTKQTQTSSTLATICQKGRAWFIHPMAMVNYFDIEVKKTETWDKVTNSRIMLLHPQIRQKAVNFINEVEKEFGIQLRVTTGLRTIEEQNRLYEQGRTTSGNIVTWVRGGYSYHNYGLAIDVIEMKNNKVNWDESVLKRISPVGIRNGFSWGGDWKKQKDYPHFEITFGYKASELLKKHNEGELDDEGYIIFN